MNQLSRVISRSFYLSQRCIANKYKEEMACLDKTSTCSNFFISFAFVLVFRARLAGALSTSYGGSCCFGWQQVCYHMGSKNFSSIKTACIAFLLYLDDVTNAFWKKWGVLSCALLSVFSALKCLILLTQSPKYTWLKRITNQFSFVYTVVKQVAIFVVWD